MSAVLITYDLNKPGQNYSALHDKIKSLGPWWHYLESTWIVSTTKTPSQVWDHISSAVDKSDRALVIDITLDRYSGWLPKAAWEWLAKYVD